MERQAKAMMNMKPMPRKTATGFTLIELLVVVALIVLLGALTGPALRALNGAGTVNKAIADLGGTMVLARTYAMAHHTYVRAVFSQMPASGASGLALPETLVLVIVPAGGDIDQAGVGGMGDPSKWPAISRPLILPNLILQNALNAASPSTSQDLDPTQSTIVSVASPFSRQVNGLSPAPQFTACIQFGPSGQAVIVDGTPARYIKLAFDRPAPQDGKDPFLLRISGINGSIDVLRKESGIQ